MDDGTPVDCNKIGFPESIHVCEGRVEMVYTPVSNYHNTRISIQQLFFISVHRINILHRCPA